MASFDDNKSNKNRDDLFLGPALKILVHSKDSLQIYTGPPTGAIVNPNPNEAPISLSVPEGGGVERLSSSNVVPERLLTSLPTPRILFSKDGTKLCLLPDGPAPKGQEASESYITLVHVIDKYTLSLSLSEVDCAEFSPLCNYLITKGRQRNGDDKAKFNLQIWDLSTKVDTKGNKYIPAECIAVFPLPSRALASSVALSSIQFTSDENFLFRLLKDSIIITPIASISSNGPPIARIDHKELTQFQVSQSINPHYIAVFTPENSGMPSKINLYKHEASTTSEISCRTSFSASSATFYWNLKGDKLLVHTHSDIDRAGTSYYGSTGLFILSTDGTISEKVPQTKEGPIYDVQWSPIGDSFIVCAGSMPAQITLYNENGQATYEFGAAHRNTISWSPHGRFLMIGGFGNLQGEMDFYDMRRVKKIGTKTAHCTVGLDWSPCSRYLLTSTTAPRMNVDNGFKIFKYNGDGPICHKQLNVAYNVKWLPAPVSSYPNRGPSPKRKTEDNITAGAGATKPAVGFYRPPGASSAFAERIAKEHGKKGVVGKIKQPTPVTAKSNEKEPAKKIIPVQSEQDKKKKGKNEKEEATNEAKEIKSNNSNKDKKVENLPQEKKHVQLSDLSAEDIAKRVKALQKKLKQIDEIKDKSKTSGSALNADQKSKIDSESTLIAELNELLNL